ncbi:outer membrane protein assembly factor BamB family protein [Tautonia sociabilis]|uniref:Pyrrolo-quinoline quinone repeat domain-containing protein n=1 Tax=Tautonia sociabilis TaxID=2080755 RepID=A0A432MNE7_9BACT|nr:PQQ-binding-like beta-propeller repeat protein [Tautonia sociabilis]RUL88964.1 hypothetical protein TsocGM_05060 [Tautonia sociabilis]
MIRRLTLAWAALGALAWAVPADGQNTISDIALPDRAALGRIGLERNWFTAVPLQAGLEQLDHLSLSADGELLFAQTTDALLYCLDAETGRLIWSADIGPAGGSAQDVGVYAEPPSLQLIPSFGTRDELPSEGRFLVVIARSTRPSPDGGDPQEVLNFRVFDADGTLALDTTEDDYPDAYRKMADLKDRLRPLWGNADLPLNERKRIVSQVTDAIGYSPASQVFAINGNFLYALDRATGRQVWAQRMEANASSPVAATLDLVIVGLVNGKLIAYSLVSTREERFRRQSGPPGGFAWNFATNGAITAEPIPTQFVVAFASNGGKLYVSQIDPPAILYRTHPIGQLFASMGTFGTGPDSRLIVPSMNGNLYGFRLFLFALNPETGRYDRPETPWVFPTGTSISAQPLVGGGDVTVTRLVRVEEAQTFTGTDLREYSRNVTRVVEQEETIAMAPAVYVLNDAGLLFAVDPETGTPMPNWSEPIPIPGTEREQVDPRTGLRYPVPGTAQLALDPATGEPALRPKGVQTGANRILALSPTRIYLKTEYGDLAVVSRDSGELVAGPSETFGRLGLDLRGFSLAVTNDVHDRIYLATATGTLICLREPSPSPDVVYTGPIPLRAASERPFGFLRDDSTEDSQTPPPVPVPVRPQAEEPAEDDNPFDFGFGALPARPRRIR